jgi:hypothetical protein
MMGHYLNTCKIFICKSSCTLKNTKFANAGTIEFVCSVLYQIGPILILIMKTAHFIHFLKSELNMDFNVGVSSVIY